MRLTTLTDYAMRLLIHVGQHPDRLCTIAEIAQAHGISEPHLMKVTHRLSQTGWLETVRGKNGGMRLSRPASEVRLGDVVRDTENDLSLVECFAGHSDCTLFGHCRLANVLNGALDQFMRHLDQFTLADVLPQPRSATLDGGYVLKRV